MKLTMGAASWVAVSILTASGQGTTGALEFEVASVKPAVADDRGPMASLPGPMAEMMGFDGGPGTKDPGRIHYHGVSLKMLLARAYQVKPNQISGPSWLGSELYTIEAILPPDTNADQLRLMLQKLLTERFQIQLHREVKETPVYRLKLARNGPKLQPPEELPQYQNEDERRDDMRKRAMENLAKMQAARGASAKSGIRGPSRGFSMARATTESFADRLSSHLDRPVKDMTELKCEYHFQMNWTPDNGMHDDQPGLSIFTAIQEQLGLKLEAGNEPIEFLVIDRAEKAPTSN